MTRQSTKEGSKTRVARHRAKTAAQGSRRVEVTVAARDAGLIKAVGVALRAGGEDAERVRKTLASMLSIEPVRTGAELVAFLRASPLVGEELMIERDQSTGRSVDPWNPGA
ncbi:MAG: hypothetical protein OXH92_22310 [Bryobacterales bacterium]|nr:hypothetical protein [Bryobacterales bacterium]